MSVVSIQHTLAFRAWDERSISVLPKLLHQMSNVTGACGFHPLPLRCGAAGLQDPA